MKIEDRHKMLRQIMWDYNILPEELFKVRHGRKDFEELIRIIKNDRT